MPIPAPRHLFRAALVATAVAALAAPAQAVVYKGTWDPAYGGIFPDLGWKGEATFFVPNACLGANGSFANASPGCGGNAMTVLTAKVEFYNASTDPGGSSVLQTLDFGPTAYVNGMSFATDAGGTDLTGVNTGFFQPVQGAIAEAQYLGSNYHFHLILSGNQAALFYTKNAGDSPGCASEAFGTPDRTLCGFSRSPATVTFVPEPETWALMLGGLAGLGLVARRRQKAA